MRRLRSSAAAGAFLALSWIGPVAAQTGDNVLLVANALSQPSEEIATYYAAKRAVPSEQVLRLPLPIAEQIERRDFDAKIAGPIAVWLTTHAAQDRILYIVLTKDVPLRIAGSGNQTGTVASVDSELALLYRRMSGVSAPVPGSVKNPYFLGEMPVKQAVRFSHQNVDLFLVTRLDGYTVADVKALIDRAQNPSRQGTIVLDGKFELRESVGNKWLTAAATNLKNLPGWSDKVVFDVSQTTLVDQPNVLGYYSWGSNAVAATIRRYHHTFVPGAIGGEFVSTDARTFKEPPADWTINDTKNIFEGSHQSLIGDLIRDGITGVAGHVAEPYLNATIRPDILFPAYLGGFNLAEAFYLAMPSVSWQTVVIGDPLCTPFPAKPIPAAELNPPVETATDMPAFFGGRRLAVLTGGGLKPEAGKFMLKSDVALAANNRAAAREALQRASALDENVVSANLVLATMAEQDQQWDEAIDRYQKVIAKAPNNYVALNNLAYALAIRKNDPAAALPLASRAYILSERDPAIADTLAWVHHLLGRDDTAQPILAMALTRQPKNAEFLMHAAFIFAGTGKVAEATRFLDEAIALDATLDKRDDIQELRKKLKPAK